jgi:molybdenum cofactor biosynthesis enzyme MoaA
MMTEPVFLSLDEILYIHTEEIKISGGEPNIRDLNHMMRSSQIWCYHM